MAAKSRLGPGGTALPGTADFSGKAEAGPDVVVPQPNTFWGMFLQKNKGKLQPLTGAAVAGTGTLVMNGNCFGGTIITADGLNNAVVEVRKNNATGDLLFDVSTKLPLIETVPIHVDDTNVLYFSCSGTGAKVQLFEGTVI